MEIETWRLAHSGQGGNETLHEEPAEETRLEENLVPKQELHVDEALHPQSSEKKELLPFGRKFGEFNSLPDQEQ